MNREMKIYFPACENEEMKAKGEGTFQSMIRRIMSNVNMAEGRIVIK